MITLLKHISGRAPIRSATPPGERIYAVGDIHGRADLLDCLLEGIRRDMESFDGDRIRLIFLGDYIDRGMQSREVIDMLLGLGEPFDSVLCLKGNHEAALLRFLADPKYGQNWMQFGGLETLHSYDIRVLGKPTDPEELIAVRDSFAAALPDDHLAFLKALPTTAVHGDYFFVHAGVRPGVALSEQDEEDLLWIRSDFLCANWFGGKVIVHGHTPESKPALAQWRIGVDTGAYASGLLSCVVLEKDSRRFLGTRKRT